MNSEGTITILLPCKNQKEEFLRDSIESVLLQTCEDWKLLVIVYPETPRRIKKLIRSYCNDPRIRMVITRASPTSGLSGSLNTGMKYAETKFISILLSDDFLDNRTIEILKRYLRKYPKVDFFHSSRVFTDSKGKVRGKVLRSVEKFSLDYFKKKGSPVKQLLCWRRLKGLKIGGFDKRFGLHGGDDYDFPWTMAEAGCKFKAIKECLYFARVHHDFYRLTTHVPLKKQVEILRKIFKKHKVSKKETDSYIKMALGEYLIKDKLLNLDIS